MADESGGYGGSADEQGRAERIIARGIKKHRLLDLEEHRDWAWGQLIEIAKTSQYERNKLRVLEAIVDRTDPVQKDAPSLTVGGNLTVLRWDMSGPEIAPPSARMALNGTSSNGSGASTSSSVTEDGERPPSR